MKKRTFAARVIVEGGKRMPAGRPSDYRPEYAEQAARLAKLGAIDIELAEFFGCNLTTMARWATQNPAFRQALKVGKEAADDRVERSLFHKALGYSFESEKIFLNKEGVPVRVPTIEHVPPSDTALIFWLKNRRKEEWRDRHEVTGKDGGPIETATSIRIEDLSPAERANLRSLLVGRLGAAGIASEGTGQD